MALRVLLADDSMTAQNMGRKILADAGFDVTAVSNGAAAMKKFAEVRPDILILDIYMPGYNGLEVCERVRATDKAIPVLLTVGKLEPYDQQDGDRVQASGVIVKPFEATDLINTVRKLAEHHEAAPTPAVTPVAPEVAPAVAVAAAPEPPAPAAPAEISEEDMAFLLQGQPAAPEPAAHGSQVDYYSHQEPEMVETSQAPVTAPPTEAQPAIPVMDIGELPPLTDDDFAMLSQGVEAAPPAELTPAPAPEPETAAIPAVDSELPVFNLGPAAAPPIPGLTDRNVPTPAVPLSWGAEPAPAEEAAAAEAVAPEPLAELELPAIPMPTVETPAAEVAPAMDPLLDLSAQVELPAEPEPAAEEPAPPAMAATAMPVFEPSESPIFDLELPETPVTPEPMPSALEAAAEIPLAVPEFQPNSEISPLEDASPEPLVIGEIPAEHFETVEVPSMVAPDPALASGHEFIAAPPEILERVRDAENIVPEQIPSSDVTLEPLENNSETTPEFLEPLELNEHPAASAAPVEAATPLSVDSTMVANIVNAVFERYKAQIISDIVRELAERQR